MCFALYLVPFGNQAQITKKDAPANNVTLRHREREWPSCKVLIDSSQVPKHLSQIDKRIAAHSQPVIVSFVFSRNIHILQQLHFVEFSSTKELKLSKIGSFQSHKERTYRLVNRVHSPRGPIQKFPTNATMQIISMGSDTGCSSSNFPPSAVIPRTLRVFI